MMNRPFAHSRFESKIIRFYTLFHTSYFPYDGLASAIWKKQQILMKFSHIIG